MKDPGSSSPKLSVFTAVFCNCDNFIDDGISYPLVKLYGDHDQLAVPGLDDAAFAVDGPGCDDIVPHHSGRQL